MKVASQVNAYGPVLTEKFRKLTELGDSIPGWNINGFFPVTFDQLPVRYIGKRSEVARKIW
jgi:hypothetical protein